MRALERLSYALVVVVALAGWSVAGTEYGTLNTASVVQYGSLGLNTPASATAGTLTLGANAAVTGAAAQAVTYGSGDNSGTNAAGVASVIVPGRGTGNAANQGSVQIQTPWIGASGSGLNAEADRLFVCGQVFKGSTTTGTADTFAKVNLATSTTGGVVYVFVGMIASDGTNQDADAVMAAVTCVNKAGTVTATATTISTPTATNNSGSVTIPFTVSVSGTAVSLIVTPAFTTIVPTSVTIQYTVVGFGPITVSPQ